jgi:polyisoprenoid-binding protein YceI
MIRYAALSAAAVILALAFPGKPVTTAGSWQIDERHSDAQVSTDGTTNSGKTKINFTIAIARMNGTVKLDGADSANSAFDFRLYPASSMTPPIGEDGRVELEWFSHHANNTLVCFHSKGTQQTPDGRLQTSGNLVLTRVDRNVELTADEAYAGPVYGPPIIHRVTRPATFVFDVPVAGGSSSQAGIQTTGTTKVIREDFPQLLNAVLGTYWPPVVQDENCQASAPNEGYAGARCTGTFLESPSLPEAPRSIVGEDYPGAQGFNAVTGEHLTILVHMRLRPSGSAAASD